MSELDWSTPEGLAAIKDHLAAQIEGWCPPIAYAVGLSSASSSGEWEFPHVNRPGGRHGLPAVVLATVLGHDGTTGTLPLTTGALEAAIRGLAPAEACTSMPHPNLAAWREVLAEATSNPAVRVAFVAGEGFFIEGGGMGSNCMRISFGAVPPEKIRLGAEKLGNFISSKLK